MDALESIREMYEEIDPDEDIKPSKRLKFSESRNPGNHGLTASVAPTKEPLQPSPVDSVGPPPMDAIESMREMYQNIDPQQIKPSKEFKSSETINPGHYKTTLSSPPSMEPSHPSPVDSDSFSSPMDAIESIREMYENIDPIKSSESKNPAHYRSTPSLLPTVEASQPSSVGSVSPSPSMDAIESIREMYQKIDREQIKPYNRTTSSPPPTREPSQPSPLDSGSPSLSMDAVKSIREMYVKMDPDEQIDSLVTIVETQLHKMNTQSGAGSSSSKDWLEIVGDGTKHAAITLQTISTEAEKLSKLDAVEATRDLTLKVVKGVGELHWVFLGLSVAAFAVESYMDVISRENECSKLLVKILELAKSIKQYSEQMRQTGKLCNAVATIVEGVLICCDYLKSGNIFRFWSARIAAAQLDKTNQLLEGQQQLLDKWTKNYGSYKDVFLSHSGKQKNFVRQLHRDLTRECVSCFFDEDDLPVSQTFPSLIFKHCETCKIAVLVLSKEFIRSKWPMLELSAFIRVMNSGKNANLKLFPIFFMISAKELSRITKDSPEWQALRVSDDTRVEWQNALKVVRYINGLYFGQDGNEVVFRDKVVKEICCLLKQINPESHLQLLDFQPVGIEKQIEDVKALLDMEGDQPASAVIVCGFGGVGKTTLSASTVQSLDWSSTDFKFCMVAIDEKAQDKTTHIIKLQKYIISKIGGVQLDFQNPLQGRRKIKQALDKKCSLLFIDNVVDKDYIRDLLPKDLSSCQLETKLRIIITSRDKNVKAELNIICKEYEMNVLSYAASKSLLLQTILQNEEVKDVTVDEERMINEVAGACRGVPLLLSVFGNNLRTERDEDSYEEALDVLRKGNLDSYRDEDLEGKLMFVYHKIKEVEVKEAFLDVCAYFHGWKWNVVAGIVDNRILRDLHRRVLVSKSGSDEVIVHDILRLMGMKEAGLTRVSNYKEFSDAVEGNLNVKGIALVSNDNCLKTIQSTELEATHQSLRVLMLGDWVTVDGPPCHRKFRNLRYLRLGDITAFPFEDPSKLDKLRVFLNRSKPGMNLSCLPSILKRVCHEVPDVECEAFARLPFQNLSSLKSFIVKTRKPVELPEELHLPASLVDLRLNRCKNLPRTICHLTALESLILDRTDMECLPQGFCMLKKLKHLSMDYCSKLAFLSEELGMSSSLEELSMKDCGNLRALPKSLGGLHSLQTLDLTGCINLQVLPDSIGELRIHSLKLHSLVNLHQLPDKFGGMPLLKHLSLRSCHSLKSLPKSFVHLKMLETLNMIECTKLSVLPQDFGKLRYLKDMTVQNCDLLKELPNGFGALPDLKSLKLRYCDSFVNLPRDFTELTCLEQLHLAGLPLISMIPGGCGRLKKLRFLYLEYCSQLRTLPDDFENMATLEKVMIWGCPEFDGAIMEKILKLQNCYTAKIYGNTKLVEKWKQMRSEIKHPIAVFTGFDLDEENKERAIRVALLNGKCVEMNSIDQLVERSSLLVGLEEGTSATVALIMLPFHIQLHQHHTLQLFVEMARETAKNNGSGNLQIVCARKCAKKYVWTATRSTPTMEEKRVESDDIRQILLSLPKESCVIPSTESKRLKILTEYCDQSDLNFVMGHVVLDIDGPKSFENFKHTWDNEISFINLPPPEISKPKIKHYNSLQNFVKSIFPEDEYVRERDEQSPLQSQSVVGKSKTRDLMEALKANGIHHLLTDYNTSKVMVDDLRGKTIGFIICGYNLLECIKLQQIYRDLQQEDSNFVAIWIPPVWPEDCGHGTYSRVIQRMPWATFPSPQAVNIESTDRPCFVILDKHGQIAKHDALPLLLAWGAKSYPFTQHFIPQSFSLMESESCLEFLLDGMNIVGRKPMKSKVTFLYAGFPSQWHKMKCKLEQLTQIHGNFEVLYVGKFQKFQIWDIEYHKQVYEDAIQYTCWPTLSFSDMLMFWYRCICLGAYQLNNESKIMMEALHGLAKHLNAHETSLVLVDNDGPVTCFAHQVLEMICESSDDGISSGEGMTMRMVKDELMKSFNRGECSSIVRTFFRDEIHNHPQHPQHPHLISDFVSSNWNCGVCFCDPGLQDGGRSYRCSRCSWRMCGSCWMAYTKQQVEQLLLAKDN